MVLIKDSIRNEDTAVIIDCSPYFAQVPRHFTRPVLHRILCSRRGVPSWRLDMPILSGESNEVSAYSLKPCKVQASEREKYVRLSSTANVKATRRCTQCSFLALWQSGGHTLSQQQGGLGDGGSFSQLTKCLKTCCQPCRCTVQQVAPFN